MKTRLVYWLTLLAVAALLSRVGLDEVEIRCLRAELAAANAGGGR